jgi:hypothetical protein
MANALYYGDNLAVLRDSIPTESVDLIYLDPPFNSNASYNVLFKAPSGEQSQAVFFPWGIWVGVSLIKAWISVRFPSD